MPDIRKSSLFADIPFFKERGVIGAALRAPALSLNLHEPGCNETITRMRMTGCPAGLCLGGLLCVSMAFSQDYYSAPQSLNVLRRVDSRAQFQTQTAWVNLNNGGGVQYAASYGIDSGAWGTQINYSSQSDANTASYRITLMDPVFIQTMKHWYGGHRAMQFRVSVSTNGFSDLTEIVAWTNTTGDGPFEYMIATNAMYIQMDFLGTTPAQYLILQEVRAFAGAGAQIPLTAGYNLVEPATAGPISQYTGWADNPNQVIDRLHTTYLRPDGTTNAHWFILPLSRRFFLRGAASGFYHGQQWNNGIRIEVTDSASLGGGTVWQTAYYQSGALSSAMLPFDAIYAVRYVRVWCYETAWSGALCELELYAVPYHPGTVVFLK